VAARELHDRLFEPDGRTVRLLPVEQRRAIMDRDVVVIVKSDQEAYEAIKALSGLSLEGTIELYSSMIIKKQNGVVIVVRDTGPHGPFGTLLGAGLGGLIGLLGGPVGAAAGAAVGGAAGITTDVAFAGIGADFVRQVATKLTEGNYALSRACGKTGRCRSTPRWPRSAVWCSARRPTDRLGAHQGRSER
jgi:uncharacterized membrane protein